MKITRILKGAGIRSSYGTMGAASVTLVEDDTRVLVDAGHFGIRDALLSKFKEIGLSVRDVDSVVLTHLNWDHCLNVDLFENASILLGSLEFQSGTLTGVKDGITDSFKRYLSSLRYTLVEDGYQVSKNTSILATPGHSPGHISLKVMDGPRVIVVSGDAIPNIRSYRRGTPDFIYHNLEQARKSIAKIKEIAPSLIFPGHDPPFNDNGYVEEDTVDIILRNETEDNTVVAMHKSAAEKPVVFNG